MWETGEQNFAEIYIPIKNFFCTWRKLHFGVDEATLEIVSVVASTNDVSDAEAMPDLLESVPVKELMLKSAISNRMTHLGMPDGVKVVG